MRSVLLLCIAIVAAGCPSRPRVQYPECRTDPDCADHGQVCRDGFCRAKPQCTRNEDCGQRMKCAQEKCVPEGGADAGKLKTISYGKERPADSGHDDAASAKNRRVEIAPEP
jgi:hypothetical protein